MELVPVLRAIDLYADIPLTRTDVLKACDVLQVSPDDIYFPVDSLIPFVYYKEYVWVIIPSLTDLEALKHLAVFIQYRRSTLTGLLQQEKFYDFFKILEKHLKIPTYISLIGEIDERERYDLFRLVWKESVKNFEMFNNDNLIDQILTSRKYSIEFKKAMQEFVQKETNEILAVYRSSTATTVLQSWTLNREMAYSLREPYPTANPLLFRAYVRRSEVLDYFPDGGEEEILIHRNSLTDIHQIT